MVWFTFQLVAACFVMRRLVRRENASPDLDLSAYVQRAQAEVGVCVAPEPHGLGEGSSNACIMAVACTVVGPVAVGCSWAGSSVVLGSLYFLSLFRPFGAATHPYGSVLPDPCTAVKHKCSNLRSNQKGSSFPSVGSRPF